MFLIINAAGIIMEIVLNLRVSNKMLPGNCNVALYMQLYLYFALFLRSFFLLVVFTKWLRLDKHKLNTVLEMLHKLLNR